MDADEVFGVQLAVIVLEHVHHRSGPCGRSRANTFHPSLRGSHLAGGINNLRRELLPLVLDQLAERVLDGRVIAFDKVLFDELDGK